MLTYKMWIGGKPVAAESGKTYKAINPANGEEIAEIPSGDTAEVDKAVEAARRAFPLWSKKTQNERSRILLRIASVLQEHAAELANLDVIDHGTPMPMARGMLMASVGQFEYAAQASRTLMGNVVPVRNEIMVYIQREPVGICALITPWNAPLGVITTKMSAALAAGCTCVVKPPSIDSMAALRFAELLAEVDGLPPGTVNVITGPGGTVGKSLASHPGIDLVSFTGSCETGKAIMAAASQTVKRLQLELGGKNPVIVLDDADLDTAAEVSAKVQVLNSGQVCASPGRFYVHQKVHDAFVEKLVAAMKRVTTGDPMNEKTQIGPLVSREHRDHVEYYIKSGVEEGAKLVLGGVRPTTPPMDKGYYVLPTVFTGVTQNMKIAREEIFGPVACILKPFTSDDEAIRLANDTDFGLTSYVWTREMARGIRFANEIRSGTVRVNNSGSPANEVPWGGFKQSCFGKENAIVGLEEYTQLKVISLDLIETKK
jgi:acyl-CoA reductase-like NAD-dependent aldehyde dehydrogenase